MKRIGNVWEYIVSEENGIQSVIDGTRQKRDKRKVVDLLYDDPDHYHEIDPQKAALFIKPICNDLRLCTWVHASPKYKDQICKAGASRKERKLCVPTLEDHIIHHMVMRGTMDAFLRGMHPNCCGSVPGRGINHIVKTIPKWLKQDKQCRYFVKLDIKKFFDSVDIEIMRKILRSKIKDEKALWAFDQILYSVPSGLPIGYYPSPFLANLYLEKLDWFIEQDMYKVRRGKRIKYVRHLLRYVDDILLFGSSKSDLKKAVNKIKRFLKEERGLEIKNNWEIKIIGKHEMIDGKWKLKDGTYWIDIGGYKFCKDASVLRDTAFLSTKRLAKKMYKNGYYTPYQCRSMNAKIAWANAVGSYNFMTDYVIPYVNIKYTRRIISNVDKSRE